VGLAATLLLAAGCGGGDSSDHARGDRAAHRDYPAGTERDFLSSCQRSAHAASNLDLDFSGYCHCALAKIEERESIAKFKVDAAFYTRKVQIPPVWREAIIDCRDKLPRS
jgi:hypothetical protein